MPVTKFTDAPTLTIPGLTVRPVAVPSRGSAELAIWLMEVAAGSSGEPHTVNCEEVFVIRSGTVTATLDGEKHPLTTGDALIVPPDTLFSIANDGTESAHMTVCTSKGVQATLNGEVVDPPWAQ